MSCQTKYLHTHLAVGLVKASDPSEKFFGPPSKGKCMETKRQHSTQDGH